MSTWMDAIHLTVLRAELRPRRPWRHDEPALALRGALGNAMLHLLCVKDAPACRPCSERPVCLIPTWYDRSLGGGPGGRPFWIRTTGATGGHITSERPVVLTWTFLGALPRPSLAVEALYRAATLGLGADRIPHDVELELTDPLPLSALARVPPPEVPLVLRTVSRLRQKRGKEHLQRPLLSDVIESAVHRVRELERLLDEPVPYTWPAPEPGGRPVECRWERGGRFSSHQGEHVDLSGVQASWAIDAGEVAPWRDLLAAAEWLQLGSGTTAGLGAVRLSSPPAG